MDAEEFNASVLDFIDSARRWLRRCASQRSALRPEPRNSLNDKPCWWDVPTYLADTMRRGVAGR